MAFQPIRILITYQCSAIVNMAGKFQNVCKRFSLDALKPFQEETITQLLKGRDSFLSVKTGGGKSICYQGFQLMWTELNGCECSVLIVSPLLSIMKEQCEYLKSCDFTSTYIGRDSSEDIDIINGNFQFLFASPESILSVNKWRDMLVASKHFKLFVVDEAHTVLHWGESEIEMEPFRIWYSKLGEIRSLIQCPVLLITATANRSARMEMQKKFCMIDCHEIIQNPDRENIKLFVHKFKSTVSHGDIFYFLIHLLKKDKELCERFLIFCPSIKTCSELFSALRMKLGHIIKHVDMFHSQSPDTVKEKIKEDMSVESGNIRVLVATSAAGMGVNFRSVKYVINYGPPKDMDGFVQQFGRAGRDGGVAMALLLFNGKQCRNLDEDMKTYTQNKETCRRDIILSAYKSKSDPKRLRHMCCDICDVQYDCNSTDCSNFKHPFYKYELPVCSSDSDNSADDMFDDDSD
ncbi:uncharacterized protein LOC128159483 [Crassostrea angulata]|nr:uncharacterized protein LOC128159483 [Crassostrea angulata]